MSDVFTRGQILTEVQKLADKFYKLPVAERCADTSQFVLRALDYALSTGTEDELAAIVQPWLHNKLFGVVGKLKGNMDRFVKKEGDDKPVPTICAFNTDKTDENKS